MGSKAWGWKVERVGATLSQGDKGPPRTRKAAGRGRRLERVCRETQMLGERALLPPARRKMPFPIQSKNGWTKAFRS